MTQIIDMPESIAARQASQNLHLRGRTGSAGRGTSNREQVVHTENRIWRAQIDLTRLGADLRLQARGLAQRLNGRVNILRIEVCNVGTFRRLGTVDAFYDDIGVSDADQLAGYLPFSDDTLFSDGTGFALPDADEPTAREDVAVGATSIRLVGFLGQFMTPFTRFSINDFLYQVETNDFGRITFAPPLREAVTEGASVKVSRPTVLLRLSSDDGFEPFERFGNWVEPTTMDLEEEFQRV